MLSICEPDIVSYSLYLLSPLNTLVMVVFSSEISASVHSPSELKVNDHKREASPLSLDESRKRHRVADQSHVQNCKSTCYNRVSCEATPSTTVCKTGISFSVFVA